MSAKLIWLASSRETGGRCRVRYVGYVDTNLSAPYFRDRGTSWTTDDLQKVFGGFLTAYACGAEIGVHPRPGHDGQAVYFLSKHSRYRRWEGNHCKPPTFDRVQVRFCSNDFQVADCASVDINFSRDSFIAEAWNPNRAITFAQVADPDVADAIGGLSRELRRNPLAKSPPPEES